MMEKVCKILVWTCLVFSWQSFSGEFDSLRHEFDKLQADLKRLSAEVGSCRDTGEWLAAVWDASYGVTYGYGSTEARAKAAACQDFRHCPTFTTKCNCVSGAHDRIKDRVYWEAGDSLTGLSQKARDRCNSGLSYPRCAYVEGRCQS